MRSTRWCSDASGAAGATLFKLCTRMDVLWDRMWTLARHAATPHKCMLALIHN